MDNSDGNINILTMQLDWKRHYNYSRQQIQENRITIVGIPLFFFFLHFIKALYTMLCFTHTLDFSRVFTRVFDTASWYQNCSENERKTQEKREKITQRKKNARTFFYITLCVG